MPEMTESGFSIASEGENSATYRAPEPVESEPVQNDAAQTAEPASEPVSDPMQTAPDTDQASDAPQTTEIQLPHLGVHDPIRVDPPVADLIGRLDAQVRQNQGDRDRYEALSNKYAALEARLAERDRQEALRVEPDATREPDAPQITPQADRQARLLKAAQEDQSEFVRLTTQFAEEDRAAAVAQAKAEMSEQFKRYDESIGTIEAERQRMAHETRRQDDARFYIEQAMLPATPEQFIERENEYARQLQSRGHNPNEFRWLHLIRDQVISDFREAAQPVPSPGGGANGIPLPTSPSRPMGGGEGVAQPQSAPIDPREAIRAGMNSIFG